MEGLYVRFVDVANVTYKFAYARGFVLVGIPTKGDYLDCHFVNVDEVVSPFQFIPLEYVYHSENAMAAMLAYGFRESYEIYKK